MKMYHGVKLNEVTEPQVFDPPKDMYVWDDNGDVMKKTVYAIGSRSLRYPVLTSGGNFHHCGDIPTPKFVTNRELACWLAKCNGEVKYAFSTAIYWGYIVGEEDRSVPEGVMVRKWGDADWHFLTREYLGLDG